jgi:hypothetical protein
MVKLVVVPDSEMINCDLYRDTFELSAIQMENEVCETEGVFRTKIEKLGCLNTIFQESQCISCLRNPRM